MSLKGVGSGVVSFGDVPPAVPYLFEEAWGMSCGESSYLDMPEDKASVVEAHICISKGCAVVWYSLWTSHRHVR